uniref:MS151 n=1 Tax=Microscilla sp. PRE1 TaxID=155537 RepID=Q93P80_9BACT|nr:helix-turn-helix domain-containing protein [Microscilla sp. PRE1]AAK62873.1 MS151 [Microscilla sp. PRE1]
MNPYIEKYKSIHPGIVLKRELKKRLLKQRPFAISIGEHPQTLNAITKGKRNLKISLALKIEKKLGLEEGSLALLQTYYDIKVERDKQGTTPDMSILRKSLFWDTDINSVDWSDQSKAVIHRVFERGNEAEKDEIVRFYGAGEVEAALQGAGRKPYTTSH